MHDPTEGPNRIMGKETTCIVAIHKSVLYFVFVIFLSFKKVLW